MDKISKGFKVEISRTPDFKAVSYAIIQEFDNAIEWLMDSKNFEESQSVATFIRLTEIEIDFCRDCKKPIEKDEVFCLRCDELRNEAYQEYQERNLEE
jgi:hypothetical protein